MTDRFLSVGEAAEQLTVHPSTIRRWIDSGRLRAYRLGEKRIGVKESDLAALATPLPARPGEEGLTADDDLLPPLHLTKEQQRRGLEALERLERLGAAIAAREGPFTTESWELLNESRDERTRDLMRAAEE